LILAALVVFIRPPDNSRQLLCFISCLFDTQTAERRAVKSI